ncbi:MAG: hypothetical protein IKB72_02075 [Ruminococcus sp.]|nr:hypothetical protein [Ruminococcus sp.]
MGKLTIIPMCEDADVKAAGKFRVYIDDSLMGEYSFGSPFSFNIDKDSYVCAEFDGEYCGKAKVFAMHNTSLVASYDEVYGRVMFTKIKKEEAENYTEKNSSPHTENSKKDVTPKKPTMFNKLSQIGGWVHTWFVVMMLIMILGTVIAFFVLIGDDLPDVAFIVLGSGVVTCLLFYLEYLLAGYFYFAARDKGYTDLMYLFFPWAFPVIGHLLIAALPDRGNGKNHEIQEE